MLYSKQKLSFLTFLLLSTMLLTACGKYQVDVELTEEQEQSYESQIENALTVLEKADVTDEEKLKTYQVLGFAYEHLGDLKQGLLYYEDALRINPYDFVALNNSAAIYEELGEYEKASRFMAVLYSNNKENAAVVEDFIRVYCKAGDTDTALSVLEGFAKAHFEDPEYLQWISSQYEFIGKYK